MSEGFSLGFIAGVVSTIFALMLIAFFVNAIEKKITENVIEKVKELTVIKEV